MVPKPFLDTIPESIGSDASQETTTVWVFPPEHIENLAAANVIQRYGTAIIRASENSISVTLTEFKEEMQSLFDDALRTAKQGEFVVVQTKDIREGRYVLPLAKVVVDFLGEHPRLWLKEIIVVAPNGASVDLPMEESLHIVHQYLLVYEVIA